jgi:hypothetical protein
MFADGHCHDECLKMRLSWMWKRLPYPLGPAKESWYHWR